MISFGSRAWKIKFEELANCFHFYSIAILSVPNITAQYLIVHFCDNVLMLTEGALIIFSIVCPD